MKNLIRKCMLSLVILLGCFIFVAIISRGNVLADPQPLQQAEDNSSSSSSSSIGNGCPKGTTANACLTQDPIVKDLNIIVNVLSGLVGVVVTAVIVVGGVQYATAGGSSEAVTKAKARITNGLLALLAFILTYAFLQWIIPGGVFS